MSRSAPSTAFLEAWNRHVSRLDQKKLQRFKQHQETSLEAYVEKLKATFKKQQEKSWSQKVANIVEPLFRVVRIYTPAALTAVQSSPFPASVVLGGIVCIMQVSSGYLIYQDKIGEKLERMGRKAHIITQLAGSIYQNDDEIQKALVDVYIDILDFCYETLKLIVDNEGEPRNRLKLFGTSLVKTFESTLGPIVKKFEDDLEDFKDKAEVSSKRTEASLWKQQQDANWVLLQNQYQSHQTAMGMMAMSHGLISQTSLFQLEQNQRVESRYQGWS